MKTYEEMAESVLRRRDSYLAERRRLRRKAAALLPCVCLAALLGVGVWRAGRLPGLPAGDVLPGGAAVEAAEESEQEKQQAAPREPGEQADGPSQTVDAPAQEGAAGTGALTVYEAVWGGSYMDEAGRTVILLTEDTAENREKIFQQNPTLTEENTIFRTAAYSLAYLTDLMARISKEMGAGTLPTVTTAALEEDQNRVSVVMDTEDAAAVARVLALDTLGGAITLQSAAGAQAQEDVLRIG